MSSIKTSHLTLSLSIWSCLPHIFLFLDHQIANSYSNQIGKLVIYIYFLLQMEKHTEIADKMDHYNDWGRKTFENATKYIDSSKAVLDHYQSKKVWPAQEKYIHKINSWLEEDSDRALVFKTQPGCGMKTVLSQWQKGIRQSNHSRRQKILTIMHFASGGSNDSNYFYSLYQIIIKLKQALKLKQSVDLLEQNIRKFFAYWLDIVSAQVEKQQIIYCAEKIYQKVVIVIEAVDRFTDFQTGKQANIAFWLPQRFPKNVKVVVSARRHSESIHHLERIGCDVIEVRSDMGIAESIHNDIKQRVTCLTEEMSGKYQCILDQLIPNVMKTNNTYSFLQFYSGVFLPRDMPAEWTESLQKRINVKQLLAVGNINQLYNFVIQNSTDINALKSKFQASLVFLALAQKGLTVREMLILTKLTQNQWLQFLGIFGCVIVKYQGVFLINSKWLVQSVLQRQKVKKGDNFNQTIIAWHQKIARALQSTENSIRKLEEQAYHLFCAKSYFRLKEMVSNIENFLLLFNPHNKYELSRCWQMLEEKGFDPVIEYNKAVQGFSMHYHPTDQNIFRIIVQISRFLKEFCDFENYDTPSFRHPLIEGNMLQLRKIGLLSELSNLQIYVDNSFNPPQALPQSQITLIQQIKELKQKYFPKQIQKSQDLLKAMDKVQSDLQNSQSKFKKKNEYPKILSEIEQLNVDVPMNRNKFRHDYLRNIKQFIKKEEDNITSKNEGGYLDVEQTSAIMPVLSNPLSANSFQKIKQNYRLRQIKPSLYYYKRWIWIQFPWICISLNNNYSTTPQLKKNIEGEDSDNIENQYKFTKLCLLVAIQAREKKRQMFSKKDSAIIQTVKSMTKSKSNIFSITKYSARRGENSAIQKVKTTQQFDLSLQALSKELQIRQKIILQFSKEKVERKLLGQIKQNCEQEMKFITLRKEFESPTIWGGQANEILPKVKWAIKQHNNYQIEYIKNHIEQKKKKLNKINYENKRLAEIYQQLRIKQALTKKNLHQQEEQKCGKKSKALQDLLKKKEDVITEFCKSLLQKERLKIILKICSQNKTRNEEYLASLNYFLQNLKKMINFQKDNMKLITENLEYRKAETEKQTALEKQKNNNRKVVEEEAQKYLQEKGRLEQQIEGIHKNIWSDIQDHKDKMEHSLTGHLKHRQEKNQIKQHQKTVKQLEDRYEKANRDYEQLKELFDLKQGQEIYSQKMKKLLQQHERNKHLKIAYFQKKNRLQQLQRELMRVKEENEKQIQKQLKKMGNVKNEKKQKQLKQNSQQQKLQILLDNLCLKLGVHDKKDILLVLQKKMNESARVECQ